MGRYRECFHVGLVPADFETDLLGRTAGFMGKSQGGSSLHAAPYGGLGPDLRGERSLAAAKPQGRIFTACHRHRSRGFQLCRDDLKENLMSSKILLFFAAFLIWCLFYWVPDGAHLLVGVGVAGIVAFTMGDVVIQRPHLLGHPRRFFYFFFHYVPVFLWEVLKASIDVAYRVIHPELPLAPGIVKVKTTLRSDIAFTLLANSITLTPGTMSVDIDKDRAVLYVHWIDVRSRDIEAATKIIVDRFENILRKIFEDEARDEKN